MSVGEAKRISSVLRVDESLHRTYTSKYQVIATHDHAPFTIADATGIPAYGSSYSWNGESDAWAFCRSIEISEPQRITDISGQGISDAAIFIVTVTHSSKPSQNNVSPYNNPLQDPPVISGSFSPYRRDVFRDKDGSPVINTANDPYIPAAQTDDAYDTLKISYNTATISLALRNNYKNAVNSQPIWGLQSRQVKLTRWDYQILEAGTNLKYVKHHFEFLINENVTPPTACIGSQYANRKGWYTVLPNSGYNYFVAGIKDFDHKQRFTYKDEPMAEPQWLQCNGDRDYVDSNGKWNIFAVEKELPFIGIPGMRNPLPGPFS